MAPLKISELGPAEGARKKRRAEKYYGQFRPSRHISLTSNPVGNRK